MIYGLAILGLNLLTGFNGQFSLGHSAFYGIGAYTAAILMHQLRHRLLLDVAGGRRRVLRRRLPVRPAGAAAAEPLSRAGDLRAGDGDAADPQIPRVSKAGPAACRASSSISPMRPVSCRSTTRPMALLLHPRRRAGDVRRRREPGAEPHRARDHGDPRQPDRRRGDGHQQFALQDADLRRQRALHRRRRRAGRARGAVCRARQLHDLSCRSRSWSGW